MRGGLNEDLLEAIYDPALRTGDWCRALCVLRELLASAEIAFTVVDSRSTEPELWETTGAVLSTRQNDQYHDDFMRLDPKLAILADRGPGFLFNDVDHFDDEFVAQDPFYQGYSLSVGTRHTLDLFVDTYKGCDIYLAAMRSAAQGPFNKSAEEKLRRASIHFVRALKTREDLLRMESAARYASAALDRFDFGVTVLDATAHLLFANAFARTAFEQQAPFRVVGSSVLARAAQKPVTEGVRAAVAGRPSTFRLRDHEEWLISTIPLPAQSPVAPSSAASALLIFRRAARPKLPGAEEIIALYGLSPAETDIALGIAAGKSLRTLAADRSVKLSTVRWQLLAVLQKLGVRRQADIVRVLAAIQPTGAGFPSE